ncbi:hypothetical protein [Aureispira sp. CCB-QB1]|uniref:hypothetical protein n=1 Tax=Aureispira sp. CCB-QB1 TaxID=1313421 RepID=UPI0006970707|nr:hypothetical protein [Aureispira sp. CCB-QB1]
MTKTTEPKKAFAKIETKEDALGVIKETANGFFVVACLQIIIGIILMPAIILDGVVLIVLGLLLRQLKSRVVAVILFLFSVIAFIMTIMNKFGISSEGGGNIFLAGLMVYISIRAIQATFRYYSLLNDVASKEDILDS